MGRSDRNATADLIERVGREPGAFGFFQLVRLLQHLQRDGGGAPGRGVGVAARPEQEPVSFRAATGMRRPETEVAAAGLRESDAKPELTVSFLGLTGPSGVLPDHYTDLVVQRRRARDFALIDFLDLFNHRLVGLFYRAWAKYRIPVAFEEAPERLSDGFSRSLAALIGMGLAAQRQALAEDGGRLLSMAGPLSRRIRSAGALERVLNATLELPVQVLELQGRWIRIALEEQTRLGSPDEADHPLAVLGETAVVGANVWDVQSCFRIRIGPLGLRDFRSFFEPEGPRAAAARVVKVSVGPAMDFDMQLILRRHEVPPLVLGDPASPAYLGQTTWLVSDTPERDRDDAVLSGSRGLSRDA